MRYIVATDGSEPSLRAARFLVRQSCPAPEDEISVIYVFPLPSDPECYDEVVLVGNPGKEIVEFATNLGVDLIVAGNRGRSAEKELDLGSVSSALAHRAPCSVLIVR